MPGRKATWNLWTGTCPRAACTLRSCAIAWVMRQYAASPRLRLRFYLDVGLLEDGRRRDTTYPTMVEANRALRDVLRTKGYDVAYAEFNGGHDYVSWRGTIADGLRFLLSNAGEDAA